MIPLATEILDLVARWVHVIAGIMWVGNSLLFNWLDRNLVEHGDQTPAGLRGGGRQSIWLLHSGGFYFVEKTLLPGQKLPAPLHWFKWQAYTTWLSGLALLLIVYWVGGRAAMTDPAVSGIGSGGAFLAGAGAILVGWMVYEAANRLIAPRAPAAALVVWVSALAAISLALTETLSGRAAYLHVGSMLGTIMAANVFFTIVPSQRQLVASITSGSEATAAADSARAKRVSIHNNYFTFPVLALMVSSHFPVLYGTAFPFVKLLVLIAAGAMARHALNVRYDTKAWGLMLAGTVTAAVVSLYGLGAAGISRRAVGPATDEPVTLASVQRIIDRRCASCHSVQPSDLTFGIAPAGIAFDTPAQVATHSNRIIERAVVSRTMPPANKTNMTDAERHLLRRWFESQ